MSAWAEGLLGAVMGGSQSMVHSMDEEEKARKLREEREAKNKDQITLEERRAEIAQRMKLQLEDLERGRLGKVARDVEAAMPSGKPAWSGNKQGDAIDAGEVSEVPMSEADKGRFRMTEYGKLGERGLVKDEMDRMEKERRFSADEAKSATDAERNRIAALAQAAREKKDDDAAVSRDRRDAAYIASVANRTAGGSARGAATELATRKFDDKQWTDSKKELTGALTRFDELSQKDVPDHAARLAAVTAMNKIKKVADVDPGEASVVVASLVSRAQAAAKAVAKGDREKYDRLLPMLVDDELKKLQPSGERPADKAGDKPASKPAAPGKPAQQSAEAKQAPPREINISTSARNARTGLEDKSVSDLMAMRASKDPVQRTIAEEEIRRRGLSQARPTGGANVSFEQG